MFLAYDDKMSMMNNNNISTNSISPSSSSNVRPPPSVAASIGLSTAAATSSMPTPSADTFNPSNPLAGVYSPKTSHLSIVQPMLDQYQQQQQQPQTQCEPQEANNEAAHEEAKLPLPPGWSVGYTMRGRHY